MIFGLTGKNGAGKTTAAEFLVSRGFEYRSLSDILRETLQREKKPVTRENLIAVGNRLRRQWGPSVLAEKVAEKLDSDRNYVIDSIRNPIEAQRLKKLPGFVLLHLEADVKRRFQRCLGRAREKTPQNLRDFITEENRELKNIDPNRQNLLATVQQADHTITNNKTKDKLYESVVGLLKKSAKARPRPDWDLYFLNIAKEVAERSNCVKRHVAAVLVKDKRIISTGYNGTPRGVRNCNEGGCPRCNSFGATGANLEECLCSHAEENAITQSAYHGVEIKGATLYTTFSPCLMCTKMIINSGIREVVYRTKYPMGNVAMGLLKEAKVSVRPLV